MDTKKKIKCSVMYHDSTVQYSGFYLVEHEPGQATAIFRRVHQLDDVGVADCFPPVIKGHNCVLAYHISGCSTLEDWLMTDTASLVYKDPNGQPCQMTDKLRLMIQDLGCVVLRSINEGINMHLDPKTIHMSSSTPPRVVAIISSSSQSQGDVDNSRKGLQALLDYIWTKCNLAGNAEAEMITRKLMPDITLGSCQQFLNSRTFWTKHVRAYYIMRLGEILTTVKGFALRKLNNRNNVLGWRSWFQSDLKLVNIVARAQKNKSGSNEEEVDCCIKFLADCLAHFGRMCRGRTSLRNPVELIEHCDNHHWGMMDALYAIVPILEKAFRGEILK